MAGELIVGYDGSAAGVSALREAMGLARTLGCGVVVAFGSEPPAPGAEMADHRAALEAHGRALMEKAMASVEGEGVDVTAVVVHERPADALLGLAEQHGARMIVVGTNAERPVVAAILGSVPLKLLHRTKIPVLVVPAGT